MRGGAFDPLQRNKKNTNPNKLNLSVSKPKPKQGSSSQSNREKIQYKAGPDSNPVGYGNSDKPIIGHLKTKKEL